MLAAAQGEPERARALLLDALDSASGVESVVAEAWIRADLVRVTEEHWPSEAADHRRAALDAANRFDLPGLRSAVSDRSRRVSMEGSQPSPSASEMTLTQDGETWLASFGGREARLRDTKGVRLLARLISEPSHEKHVLDLASETGMSLAEGAVAPLLDAEARKQFRERLREIEVAIDEASRVGDTGRRERAVAEQEWLERELSAATGLGGRSRQTGSAAERARVNVQRRIRDAIRRVSKHDSDLARHLERSVKTGVFCVYDP